MKLVVEAKAAESMKNGSHVLICLKTKKVSQIWEAGELSEKALNKLRANLDEGFVIRKVRKK